ncbi:MAG: hypothetical protein QM784_24335 [Polyangiaceae bacterium]
MLPGLALQACALLVVLGYVFVPEFHSALDSVGELKVRYGYLYSAIATAFFGGLVPFLYLRLSGKIAARVAHLELIFYIGFWLWKGMEVDALYRLQSTLFGDETTFRTIATKAFVDQFVYSPIWATPTQVIFFLYKDSGFSLTNMRARLREESFPKRLIVVLISTWVVWIPTVAIVYSLPSALQIPLFNLVLCFWCLLLSTISKNT